MQGNESTCNKDATSCGTAYIVINSVNLNPSKEDLFRLKVDRLMGQIDRELANYRSWLTSMKNTV